MARVLIVSKTWWGSSGFCVGGLDLDTNKNIRLLDPNQRKQPRNTPFNIGQIWDMDYLPSEKVNPPHNEDVFVQSSQLVGNQPQLSDFLLQRIQPWIGGIHLLFDGLLTFQNRWGSASYTAFISRTDEIPSCSTGFWIPDKPLLILNGSYNGSQYYIYNDAYPKWSLETYKIAYVGLAQQIDCLPEKTLIRVSLARWWPLSVPEEERKCYLQISGWYI